MKDLLKVHLHAIRTVLLLGRWFIDLTGFVHFIIQLLVKFFYQERNQFAERTDIHMYVL